mmetsp:Transcript_31246/g.43303  ORF Transcript_31246/g.43303 Transcript_31246/m.43303 type:complete len:444 (-) Transcript_31246:357-1688(-)|eukprot:CAMPEP_0196595052 /NCGR_PEP_ID=MMETSP1081-20130531/80018_1 /TAXON_ID=36882 /ORGANISM="Pyramimonas amylifera, Strain CCMP720" /LENGTH=443 /DNA_ID=CAMNT_0041919499 /DNA_START=279 /DNA_END=1610 /DNA_ORIENTATION=-
MNRVQRKEEKPDKLGPAAVGTSNEVKHRKWWSRASSSERTARSLPDFQDGEGFEVDDARSKAKSFSERHQHGGHPPNSSHGSSMLEAQNLVSRSSKLYLAHNHKFASGTFLPQLAKVEETVSPDSRLNRRRGSEDIMSQRMDEIMFPDLDKPHHHQKKGRSQSLDVGLLPGGLLPSFAPPGTVRQGGHSGQCQDMEICPMHLDLSTNQRRKSSLQKYVRTPTNDEDDGTGSEVAHSWATPGRRPALPGLTAVSKDVRNLRKYYDELAARSMNGKGTVSMEQLEKDLLSTMSAPHSTCPPHIFQKLRRSMKDVNNVSFQQLLRIYYPGKSRPEIQRMVEDAFPAKKKTTKEGTPPDDMLQDLNEMWDKWDTDASGALDKYEFRQALMSLGINDRDEFENIYAQIDISRSGIVDKSQFLSWWICGDPSHTHKFKEPPERLGGAFP